MDSAQAAGNRETRWKLLVVVLIMGGFGYALVPFYKAICEITGINELVKADAKPANTQIDTSRKVTVEFDANSNHLPWRFRPLTGSIEVHPGELVQVIYEVTNVRDRPMTGQAIPSYAPKAAAQYFKKLECFCFKQQTLAAHESRQFPVVFVIDPDMSKDVTTITLSYTFFEIAGKGNS
ncbi:MAG: cytochrome c oxidase assembly protein [Burkholderiales bacterium]|nr:cytochrome c oxidase assembly protein [Burkholderiales bacterium]